ncbi:MAG: VCBS repeat-containing protein, partial [Bacteroidota bacterium]
REDVLFGAPFRLRLSEGASYREVLLDGPPESATAVLTDVDGDGDEDLLLLAAGNEWPAGSPRYRHYLYRNDGAGQYVLLAPERLPLPDAPVLAAASTDFDGDGRPDLFIGGSLKPQHYPQHSPSTVLLNRSVNGRIGYLPLPVSLPAEVGPVRAAVAFSDAVLFVNDFGVPTRLRVVDGKCQLEPLPGTEHLQGWWRSLAVVDVDGDGDLDVVAGNQGKNHALVASLEHPVRLYLNDYDANGRADPVLSRYYTDRREYPVAPRGLLTQQMPGIKRRFPTYRAYAEAEMDALFTVEERRGEVCYRATTMESMLLVNNGNGTFTPRPLPRLAQQAPLQDLLPTDLDGDGDLDLLALCGDRSGNVRLGYADGVPFIRLRNDGHGLFTAELITTPPWDRYRDGRALARLADGSCVVAANDGLVFPLPSVSKRAD